jgi:acyl carrier protein
MRIAVMGVILFDKTVSIYIYFTVMDKDGVFEKLKEVLVSQFELDAGAISLEKRLYEDLDLDSLDAVDLVIGLKGYITGKIDPALFKGARTLRDLVDILQPLWKSA